MYEGLFITAICMISVQYTSLRPINYPVNHEIHVLLLQHTCVCASREYNSCNKLKCRIRNLLDCTKILYDTTAVSQINDLCLYASSVTVCGSWSRMHKTSVHNIIHPIIGNIVHYVVIKYLIIRGHSTLPITDVPGVYKVLSTLCMPCYLGLEPSEMALTLRGALGNSE
jgi:hypothetical protein